MPGIPKNKLGFGQLKLMTTYDAHFNFLLFSRVHEVDLNINKLGRTAAVRGPLKDPPTLPHLV